MTTRRPNRQLGMLKAAILTGSLLATFAGTYILGLQEPAAKTTAARNTQPAALTVPADKAAAVQMPPEGRAAQIELGPIPQAVQPQLRPVARTRSSQ